MGSIIPKQKYIHNLHIFGLFFIFSGRIFPKRPKLTNEPSTTATAKGGVEIWWLFFNRELTSEELVAKVANLEQVVQEERAEKERWAQRVAETVQAMPRAAKEQTVLERQVYLQPPIL